MKLKNTVNNFDLIMIVTHRDTKSVNELLLSIESCYGFVNVFVIIISQVKDFSYSPDNKAFNLKIIFQSPIGLSKARNIGLEFLSQNNYSSEYIMFPDDDTSFDHHFFANFKDVTSIKICLVTPIFNKGSKELYIGSSNKTDFEMEASDLRLIGSPNQILLYDKLKNYLFFDENLGLGAKYGSSEDMDLFLRLLLRGEKFIYTNKLYTYHPKKTSNYEGKSLVYLITRFNNYSTGYAYLIYKHNLFYFFPNYLFRTIAASLYFLLKLKFKLSLAYFIQFILRLHKIIIFGLQKLLK